MAFIDDDEIKGFDGHLGVVLHQLVLLFYLLEFIGRQFLCTFVNRRVTENGVHALNSADADFRRAIDGITGEALNNMILVKEGFLTRWFEGMKLLLRLLAQVFSVDQK